MGVAGHQRSGWSPARALDGLIDRVADEYGLGALVFRRGGVIPSRGPRPVLVKQRVMLVGDVVGKLGKWLGAGAMAVFGEFLITLWYGDEYAEAGAPLPSIAGGIVMMAMYIGQCQRGF